MKIKQLITLLCFVSFNSYGQVLLDLNENAKHSQIAKIIKQRSIKSIDLTFIEPIIVSDTLSEYMDDTITLVPKVTSTSYNKNGFIEIEKQILQNGDLYNLKEFCFDSIGNLIKTKEINNSQIRYYDYQELTYFYNDNKIDRIEKIRYKKSDTTFSTTNFFFSDNYLENVIETNNLTGDTLLISYFTYNLKKRYVLEKNYNKNGFGCKASGCYHYFLDKKGRILKVKIAADDYEKKPKTYETKSYDFSNEIPKPWKSYLNVKIEKYE
ncbi:MAG: hypothetical protein WCK02_18100 [Bacteroidota bacterium]